MALCRSERESRRVAGLCATAGVRHGVRWASSGLSPQPTRKALATTTTSRLRETVDGLFHPSGSTLMLRTSPPTSWMYRTPCQQHWMLKLSNVSQANDEWQDAGSFLKVTTTVASLTSHRFALQRISRNALQCASPKMCRFQQIFLLYKWFLLLR